MNIAYYIIGLITVIILCETAELYLQIKHKKNENLLTKKNINRYTKHYLTSVTSPDDNTGGKDNLDTKSGLERPSFINNSSNGFTTRSI